MKVDIAAVLACGADATPGANELPTRLRVAAQWAATTKATVHASAVRTGTEAATDSATWWAVHLLRMDATRAASGRRG